MIVADQEFLASFAVDIDEAGVARLQKILADNKALADSVSAAFQAATKAMKEFAGTLPTLFSGDGTGSEAGVPSILEGDGGGLGTDATIDLGLDTTDAENSLNSFIADAKKPLSLSANMSGAISSARSAFESIRNIFSQPITVTVHVETDSDGAFPEPEDPGVPMSTGGRFKKPTHVEVAEDENPEYIIPVAKEHIAIPLVQQLLFELSPSARESILGMMKPSDDISDLSAGLEDMEALNDVRDLSAGTVTETVINQTSQNVSAPISIEVNASGADPEQIGRSVYNAAERYLLRTMRSVFA